MVGEGRRRWACQSQGPAGLLWAAADSRGRILDGFAGPTDRRHILFTRRDVLTILVSNRGTTAMIITAARADLGI